MAAGDHDSEACFTVTQEKAIQKLSSMALENSADWVLKVVQASVAGNAEKLAFKRNRNGLYIEISGLQDIPELDQLKEQLLSSNLEAGTFSGELSVGLRTLLFQAPFVLSLAEGSSLFWNGAEFQPETLEPSKAEFRIWVVQSGWSVKAARRYLELLGNLYGRALYAPLLLSIDGKPVDPVEYLGTRLSSREAFGELKHSVPLVHATFDPNEGESPEEHEITTKKARLFRNRLWSTGFLLSYAQTRSSSSKALFCSSRLVFTRYSATEAARRSRTTIVPSHLRVRFTRLGVVCAEVKTPSMIECFIEIEAEEARSDLSGLNIEPPEPSEQISASCLELLRGLHNRASEVLRKMERNRDLRKTDLYRGLVGTVGGAATIFLLIATQGLALPVAGKAGLAGGAMVGGLTIRSGSEPLSKKDLRTLATTVDEFAHNLGSGRLLNS